MIRLEVEPVSTTAGFETLRGDWNHLAGQRGSIFQTWEWARGWWGRYGRGRRLMVLVARLEGRVAAIAPFFVTRSYAGLPLRIIGLLGTGHSDYGGILAEEGAAEPALSAILDHLARAGDWDIIDLHQIPENGPEPALLRGSCSGFGFSLSELEQDTSYVLSLPEDWEEVLGLLSKKFRWNITYYARRLAKDHGLTIVSPGSAAEVGPAVRTFLRLHRKRWLSKKKPGRYLSPRFAGFISDVAALTFDAGWLRLYVMELDGSPVAALLGFSFGSDFYYYLGGFEPKWGGMSVSTVLLAEAVRDSIGSGLTSFDFLRGDESYKKRWSALPVRNLRFLVGRNGRKAELARRLLLKEAGLARAAKSRFAES